METKQFFDYYDAHHKNPVNRVLHFISVIILILCCAAAIAYNAWWLMAVGIFEAYYIPHLGHKYFEKNSSMRNAYPVGCVLGNARMFVLTCWNFISGKRNKNQVRDHTRLTHHDKHTHAPE